MTATKAPRISKDIEFEPDAWQRFERAIDVVVKSPPQHRKKKPTAKKKSPRAKKG